MFLKLDDNQVADELLEGERRARQLYRNANELYGWWWGFVFSRRNGRTPQQVVQEMEGNAAALFRAMELVCAFLGAAHELTINAEIGAKISYAQLYGNGKRPLPPVVPAGWVYVIDEDNGTVTLKEVGQGVPAAAGGGAGEVKRTGREKICAA